MGSGTSQGSTLRKSPTIRQGAFYSKESEGGQYRLTVQIYCEIESGVFTQACFFSLLTLALDSLNYEPSHNHHFFRPLRLLCTGFLVVVHTDMYSHRGPH